MSEETDTPEEGLSNNDVADKARAALLAAGIDPDSISTEPPTPPVGKGRNIFTIWVVNGKVQQVSRSTSRDEIITKLGLNPARAKLVGRIFAATVPAFSADIEAGCQLVYGEGVAKAIHDRTASAVAFVKAIQSPTLDASEVARSGLSAAILVNYRLRAL